MKTLGIILCLIVGLASGFLISSRIPQSRFQIVESHRGSDILIYRIDSVTGKVWIYNEDDRVLATRDSIKRMRPDLNEAQAERLAKVLFYTNDTTKWPLEEPYWKPINDTPKEFVFQKPMTLR